MRKVVLYLLLFPFLSCKDKAQVVKKNENEANFVSNKELIENEKLTLNFIAPLPKDLDSCFCYYSYDEGFLESKKYVLLIDAFVNSTININGVNKKFILNNIDYVDKNTIVTNYVSGNNNLEITTINLQNANSNYDKKSKLILKTFDGKMISKSLIGKCKC
jgi:hypothetical protein